MADFDVLRTHFSVDDEGARDLTQLKFCKLNRVEAEKLIANVRNVVVKSDLQDIYDQAHPQGKTSIIRSHSSFFALFVVFSCLLTSCSFTCCLTCVAFFF
jgi:hypothetical protein